MPYTLQAAHFDYGHYQRKHVIATIEPYRSALGHCPTQWEYGDWSRLQRGAARHADQPDPKLPTLPRIAKAPETALLPTPSRGGEIVSRRNASRNRT